jgi:hypothetical protein
VGRYTSTAAGFTGSAAQEKNNVLTSSRCFHKTQFLTCHCRLTKCQDTEGAIDAASSKPSSLLGKQQPPVGVAKQAAILKL